MKFEGCIVDQGDGAIAITTTISGKRKEVAEFLRNLSYSIGNTDSEPRQEPENEYEVEPLQNIRR